MAFFFFVIPVFVPEILKFSNYANLVTDDVMIVHIQWCDTKLKISPSIMKQCY